MSEADYQSLIEVIVCKLTVENYLKQILCFSYAVISCIQVVTVGVVGGSDLNKISEQLRKTGLPLIFFTL